MFGFVTSELRAGDPKVITDERTAGRVHHRAQIYGSFRKLGVTLLWGSYNKDPTI